MTDDADLHDLAFKAERAASRKLARRDGIDPAAALRATLTAAAADGDIQALLRQRRALAAAAESRMLQKRAQEQVLRDARAQRHLGPPSLWRAWFDGSAHPNPGRCGIGALLVGPAGQRIEITRAAGIGSSSEAEYAALLAVLQAALEAGAAGLTIHGDSRVVIDDVNGADSAAAVSLAPMRDAARALMAQLDGVTFRWLPRHRNGEADALSQRAVANWHGDPAASSENKSGMALGTCPETGPQA